jgi:DNA-binding NarL/FixJ family response regulator
VASEASAPPTPESPSTADDAPVVFLLEDNPARLAEMLAVLALVLPNHRVHVEDDAARANAAFDRLQGRIELVSLDHDLDSVVRPGEPPGLDHGDGRQVTDLIASRQPTCPVIVHTSNTDAGDGMVLALRRAGWPVFRSRPHDRHAWVRTEWADLLRRLVKLNWVRV